jgi:hypothetical protein
LSQSKFKNPSGGFYLQALFYETCFGDKATVVYTLKNHDHAGYPSLYLRYMEADDLTEYKFATENLDGWDHWKRLCKAPFFKEYVQAWREELEVRTKSRALANLIKDASSGSKSAAGSSRYIVEYQGSSKKHGRGRPSKDQIAQEAQKIANESTRVEDDFQRIMN